MFDVLDVTKNFYESTLKCSILNHMVNSRTENYNEENRTEVRINDYEEEVLQSNRCESPCLVHVQAP